MSTDKSTGYAFGLTTPRDFLEKARREVNRLESAMAQAYLLDEPFELQDAAINAAWTLWHIADWIANSPDPQCRKAVETIRRERTSLKEYVRDNEHIELVRLLANGAKHFILDKTPRLDEVRLTRPHEPSPGTVAVTLVSDVSVQAGVSTVLSKYVPKLRINDTGIPALDALKAALAYWDKFFAENGL